ncbi:4-oxalocrotonate tautomerase [Marinobacter sp. EhC06]|jgi:4-oxalocrotonate tautomerase|uniref:tautomerase family protein n=1 Tax=Marinobacter TaxID=2742 RepID=UPI0007D94F03|nr:MULTISPECIES: tautomerase family protein [unclassified Marinobacter]OAN92893.1 4-oxalocrotonate tautomerase [Marinobacter sp. EhN04]OAN96419.1 4-oxalocrotonate tautomerase [Marinobacter sp. EhC06]
MPIIEMHLMEGRTTEQKSSAAKAITSAVISSLGVPAESVRVLITEHRGAEFYVAGVAPALKTQQAGLAGQKEVED